MLFVEKKRMIIMKTLQIIISLVKETLNPIVIAKQSNHLLD